MRTSDCRRKTRRGLTLCLAPVAMIAATLGSPARAEEAGADKGPAPYDFYANTVYPGPKLRPDVEFYQVTQAGKGDPLAYERREVDWWPRKGVDVVEVKPGMPLRTWTWLAGAFDPVKGKGADEEPVEEVMETLEAEKDVAERFFRRIVGYLYPPATGEYTFVFAADDRGALYLSSDERPENKKRIAWNQTWAKHRRWNMFASQTSDAIPLEGGQRYYLEVVQWPSD